MRTLRDSVILSTGLAIFSMLFGAGNLMYPIKAGLSSGCHLLPGMLSFLTTAVIIPVFGLVAMILFDGNYRAFFGRLGERTANIVIACCMVILGPGLVIPRIVTLSHTMLAPYLGLIGLQEITATSSFIFALLFLGTTYLLTFRESKIVELLGTIISPLLLISLVTIVVKALMFGGVCPSDTMPVSTVITKNLLRGYETLDLMGTIFFSAMIYMVLRQSLGKEFINNAQYRMRVGLQSGIIGVGLLGLVYLGMGYLGAYFGQGLDSLNEGELFSAIVQSILGNYGGLVIAVSVLMACLSTSIALSAVVAEYLAYDISNKRISFPASLAIVLVLCVPLSVFGLNTVAKITGGPLTFIGYPALIMLTLCNIAYKIFGFKHVTMPVLGTAIICSLLYFV